MSNRALLRELKKFDPKALMKKSLLCEFVHKPTSDGIVVPCTNEPHWFFKGKFYCKDHVMFHLCADHVISAGIS